MRNSLLVSLVLPPRRLRLILLILAQTPLGPLVFRLSSRSIMPNRGNCTTRDRRQRSLRPGLLRLLAPITLVDPRIIEILVVLGLAQQHCLVS